MGLRTSDMTRRLARRPQNEKLRGRIARGASKSDEEGQSALLGLFALAEEEANEAAERAEHAGQIELAFGRHFAVGRRAIDDMQQHGREHARELIARNAGLLRERADVVLTEHVRSVSGLMGLFSPLLIHDCTISPAPCCWKRWIRP